MVKKNIFFAGTSRSTDTTNNHFQVLEINIKIKIMSKEAFFFFFLDTDSYSHRRFRMCHQFKFNYVKMVTFAKLKVSIFFRHYL